ncbi:MAG TPA: SLC13 family permease [Acidimicrobiales bacterium]|nr:SLC13 family permease [Acidimicrobiales bacterium]
MAGTVALGVAAVTAPSATRTALSRTWSPFVLVAGLLLIGEVAHEEGAFDRAAATAARLPGGEVVLLVALLGLAAAVTAVLNLDTSVAFLTPVLILTARRRKASVQPFVFGSLFMANAASLLLPGSNLTNLLVLGGEHISGATFAARMFPAWVAAVVVTAGTVVAWGRFRDDDRDDATRADDLDPGQATVRGYVGITAAVLAAVTMVALPSAALPVAAIAVLAVAVRLTQRRLGRSELQATVDVPVLCGLFGLATALWSLAGTWSGPSHLMGHLSGWESAAAGALAAVALNNLPAAALLGSHAVAHPRALLLGLDLGPNLAVTGSLSALLWFQSARSVGFRPSPVTVSKVGAVLVPISMAAALLALKIFAPGQL